MRTDQLAAAALGINVGRVKIVALCISAALASLSGSLYAFNFHFLSPEMVATTRSFEMIAMLVLGGEGTLIGGLFGSIFITMLPTVDAGFRRAQDRGGRRAPGRHLPDHAGRAVRPAGAAGSIVLPGTSSTLRDVEEQADEPVALEGVRLSKNFGG